ncbi:MAG: HAD-IA family hydrolase [Proteobacteria bacterium]|nr:HAD-IA family hydrolase [Pseudomonadota bacterium]
MSGAPERAAVAAGTRAVLFDLDGTLLDTACDITDALNRVRQEQGCPPLPYEQANCWVSRGALAMTRLGFPEAEGEQFEALRQRVLQHYRRALVVKTRPYEGVEDALQDLDRRAIPWGIVTNKAGWLTEPLLAHFSWSRGRFLVCGDTLPHRKPHPQPLLHAARALAVAPAQCLYVGDAEGDVLAARAAGMPVYVARFGYVPPGEQPESWPADGWLQTPADMVRLLGSIARQL